MEKSSYCCCYSHGRFNTGERNFHLSTPHSSPHTEQHTSPLRAEPSIPLPQRLIRSDKIFSDALPVKPRRQVTVELHNPDQMWSSMRYSRNLKCLSWIIWHRSSKTWRTTKKLGEKRGGGGLVAEPTLWPDCTAGCQEEQYCQGATSRIHLTLIKASQGKPKKTAGEATSVTTTSLCCNTVCKRRTQQPWNL